MDPGSFENNANDPGPQRLYRPRAISEALHCRSRFADETVDRETSQRRLFSAAPVDHRESIRQYPRSTPLAQIAGSWWQAMGVFPCPLRRSLACEFFAFG